MLWFGGGGVILIFLLGINIHSVESESRTGSVFYASLFLFDSSLFLGKSPASTLNLDSAY